ncbi:MULTISPECIES: DUF4123 domain-containing protein [Pseudomonas]|jgi:hypothetical protein|uniref:DUF4123 domain-containing protein n=1 Tax=Pseudomonas TaxID=286 RepID=UPI000F028409|nr:MULTISPECIES: DUF4123 domain-containing protein [Pseudomonas]MBV4469731.1 DUF4123 domain-containing protein [Pseudomonas siliginis]MDH2082074.1 DUF4123 domain-containing protein [Pseudomonas atacamensis]
MSEWLSHFLEKTVATTPLGTTGNRTLYGIIDSVRQPRALEKLYQQSGLTGVEKLFQDTPFAEMNDVSPIWIQLIAGSPAAAQALELCRDNRAGILLTSCEKPETALLHARRLLRMNDPAHGDSLARYYDPAFWSALALTVPARPLFGPWDIVYTPPAHSDDQQWRVWEQREKVDASNGEQKYPLQLKINTLIAFDEIRWWYWIRLRNAESAVGLSDSQLSGVADNLQLLVDHGIAEGRHLERLLPNLNQGPLQARTDVMNLLSSDMPAFEKVQRMEV